MRWHWDAVEFAIIYPHDDSIAAGNNRSCVLQIDAGGALILLPGDIERAAEQALLARGQLRPVRILVAPHHGSRSSSTAAFVERLEPRYVVFSSGYRNRFRHPHPSVVERYRQRGAELLNTADSGAISFSVRNGVVVQITQQRLLSSHYWQQTHESEQQ
jgi:competence protein ComEC